MEQNGTVLSSPHLNIVSVEAGLRICKPLSRIGYGPGIILVVPSASSSNKVGEIENGIPSPLVKWAEESYTVIEIQSFVLEQNENPLARATTELSRMETCQPKDSMGIVCYDSKSWKNILPLLDSCMGIVGSVLYAGASDLPSFAATSIPCMYHLAGKSQSRNQRSKTTTTYDYPAASSSLFAVPFQSNFHYSSESVSHTRNLSFLKRLMDGPYFDLEAIWDEHTYYEFADRSVAKTMATMVNEPYVNHIPTMTGGIGHAPLSEFYEKHFIFNNPENTELELISRTVGIDKVVDEFVFKFTHDTYIDWLLPGVPPTGKRAEVPFTAVVNIRGDKLYHEHISWDQGTVLTQLGLLPDFLPYPYANNDANELDPSKTYEYRLPVAGFETASKMRDKNSVKSNAMFDFQVREHPQTNGKVEKT